MVKRKDLQSWVSRQTIEDERSLKFANLLAITLPSRNI